MGLFSSNKSSTVNNQTDNYFFDQRQVNDASGGGVIGSGNYLDGSQNWNQTTNWAQQTRDSNNQTWTQRTTDSNNQFWDGSNRSTNTNNWSDNSQSSVTVTDGGAFQAMYGLGAAQTDAAKAIGLRGIDAAQQASGWASTAALKAQENAISSNDKALAAALGFAKSASDTVAKSSADALGWAGEQFGAIAGITASVLQANGAATASATQAATAAAGSTEQFGKYAMAGAAVLALLFIFKKG